MRINIPLLPILIEIRWRPLGPFQFTLRGLMLLVVIVGVFFALTAQTVRLQKAGSFSITASVAIRPATSIAWVSLSWSGTSSIPVRYAARHGSSHPRSLTSVTATSIM